MRLARSKSQSSSSPHSGHLFSGFQPWRRRRPSNSVPTSPLATSSTTPTESSRSPSPQQDTDPITQLYHPQNTTWTQEPSQTNTTPTDTTSQDNLHIRLLPNIGLTSRCFVFDIIDRILTPTTILKIGRYSERSSTSERISFKSKVVSRSHAELWMDKDRKIFIRDIGSSSGTFINRHRLSESNETSSPMELKDGDIIQLGVDYQGGLEQMFRCVKIRLELDRNHNKDTSFSRQAFQQLQQSLLIPSSHHQSKLVIDNTTSSKGQDHLLDTNPTTIQECCICLYAIAPLQALFVAPCSHVFHFKCLRPIIFQHYPGFSCPLCRNYYDLEASVAIEVSEVIEAMDEHSTTKNISSPPPLEQPSDQHGTHQTIINRSSARPTVDGFLFSNTLIDFSMLDQEGGYSSL
ncbi:hypothetical protein BC941DRAFT_425269 [Chlamydoabsidia padenii]|nr:hypothetical protein BC941DRAFT_425269 [Chlamydoabsidia padenii]